MRLVVVRLFETYAVPYTSRMFPTGNILILIELTIRVKTFAVPTLDEFTNKFVVVKALDAQTFPDTSSVFPVVPVPIPTLERKMRENVFMTPETFEFVPSTFVVESAFEATTLPWKELSKRTDVFTDVMFALVKKRFPKGTETFPIVEEAVPATIFPYKVVVVP